MQADIKAGYRIAVDLDLAKFFDNVEHDILMARVARKVRDKRLLALIGQYLRAGVMVGEHASNPARSARRKADRSRRCWPTSCWMIWTGNWNGEGTALRATPTT